MIEDAFDPHPSGPDALERGFYLIQRRRARRVDIPVRIWFGPPIDEDGLELDRSPRWQVMVAGALLEADAPFDVGGIHFDGIDAFWPACRDDRISQAEYDYRLARTAWAAEHDPDDAFSTPGGRINPMTATLPYS